MLGEFYKKNDGDIIWWARDTDYVGRMFFSFDKKTVYNLFSDYPDKLTKEQRDVFEKENPYWKRFFEGRKQ